MTLASPKVPGALQVSPLSGAQCPYTQRDTRVISKPPAGSCLQADQTKMAFQWSLFLLPPTPVLPQSPQAALVTSPLGSRLTAPRQHSTQRLELGTLPSSLVLAFPPIASILINATKIYLAGNLQIYLLFLTVYIQELITQIKP